MWHAVRCANSLTFWATHCFISSLRVALLIGDNVATAADIIGGALEDLGIKNELSPSHPNLEGKFFDALIRMINRWSSIGIDIGITLPTVPADELGNPDSTEDALRTSLAIDTARIAKVVPAGTLRKDQKLFYRALKSAFGLWPEQSFPSSMPLGQGNRLGPRGKRFFPKPTVVGADDNTGLGV